MGGGGGGNSQTLFTRTGRRGGVCCGNSQTLFMRTGALWARQRKAIPMDSSFSFSLPSITAAVGWPELTSSLFFSSLHARARRWQQSVSTSPATVSKHIPGNSQSARLRQQSVSTSPATVSKHIPGNSQ